MTRNSLQVLPVALATQMLMMQGLGGVGLQGHNHIDTLGLQASALGLSSPQVEGLLHQSYINSGGLYGGGQMYGGGNGLRFL